MFQTQYQAAQLVLSNATKIKEEIESGKEYPFDSITDLSLANSQKSYQKPISFNRSVISSMLDPSILKHQSEDVQRRVKFYNDKIGVPIGAYSHTSGYQVIKEAVCDFIQRRDGTATRPNSNDILLTDGASAGIKLIFKLLMSNPKDCVMIPVPTYPLYFELIAQTGVQYAPYYLIEDKGWSIEKTELECSYNNARRMGIKPKLLIVTNPGNPTGQVLDEQTIMDIITFASEKQLVIIADEVFQDNVCQPLKKFISFRKVALELNKSAEIYSFHSISKGLAGEGGMRQGYIEITTKIDPEVHFQIQKSKIIMYCSNTIGQLMLGLMVTPPTKEEGCTDETVNQYNQECNSWLNCLQRKAEMVKNLLNKIKGVSCQSIEGSIYAFPRIELPVKLLQQAWTLQQAPDVVYCLELLKATGLVVVPGSAFLQYGDTNHFRMTIDLPEEILIQKIQILKEWHENYIAKFQ